MSFHSKLAAAIHFQYNSYLLSLPLTTAFQNNHKISQMALKSLFKKTKPTLLTPPKNFTNDPKSQISEECSVEAAKKAMSKNRLFFDKASKELVVEVPIEGSVAVKVESKDLYKDFYDSMKEMVEISDKNGEVIKDFEWLEEMLAWYLKMNKRSTHEAIVLAYWDLVMEVYVSSSSSTSISSVSTISSFVSSSSTPFVSASFSSSSYVSCLCDTEEVEEELDHV